MPSPMLIAKQTDTKNDLVLLPALTNRHGLVAGATGTGKTVTLQVIAEALSRIGVPVFAADVKGDLSGISQPGQNTPKFAQRLQTLGFETPAFAGCPVTFWDVFGEQGHPVRATISEIVARTGWPCSPKRSQKVTGQPAKAGVSKPRV